MGCLARVLDLDVLCVNLAPVVHTGCPHRQLSDNAVHIFGSVDALPGSRHQGLCHAPQPTSANRQPFRSVPAVLSLSAVADPDAAAATAAAAAPVTAAPTADFVLPVAPPPIVLTPFAPPANRYGAGHRGVDLAAAAGSTVVSAGTGVVVFAGQLAGRGVVSVEHTGGLRTTYEPVTAGVTAGAPVARGQPIGVLEAGHEGCAPADCLHWGARLPDRVYLDPLALLKPWEVRLWPWDGR